uniref:Uncharacterized protein n=1 Tax=Arundo donax TaxID=35708 RepID=A0A0A9G160_ARUDO
MAWSHRRASRGGARGAGRGDPGRAVARGHEASW